jgi:SOS response regulatory protein OraA/RecX
MMAKTKHEKAVEKTVKWAEKQAEAVKSEAKAEPMTRAERKKYVAGQELGGDALSKVKVSETRTHTHESDFVATNNPPEVFTNKVGRPTKYEFEKTNRQVKLLASKGFSGVEISEALDVS